MSETAAVVSPALALLKAAGFLCWRNNTSSKMLRGRLVQFGLGKGSADIVGLLKSGRFFAIECKVPNGKASMDQIAWGAAVIANGGHFDFAKTPERAIELVRMWERMEVANG